MKTPSILLLSSMLFLGLSCKKKQYSDTSPAPTYTFNFNGNINNAPINILAGAGNYYLFTDYVLDGNGVYDFTGEFRDKDCNSNCPNSLKISIKDYRINSVMPTTIDSSLITGYYAFASPAGTASKYAVQFFDSLYNGIAQSYMWDFGDGSTSTQHKPLHVYSHPGAYNVMFNCQSTASCSSSLNNSLLLGQVGNAFANTFSVSFSAGNVVHYVGSPGGVPISTFTLDFGDGAYSYNTAWTHTYSAPGVYNAKLTVIDATGYTAISNLNGATQNPGACNTYFYPKITTPIINAQNLGNVTVEWHDGNGNLFTSNNNAQPQKSFFKIISVEPYQNNINGQPTKKIHATVTCTLYNGTNSIPFTGDVVFSVAY